VRGLYNIPKKPIQLRTPKDEINKKYKKGEERERE
jgi:hypothetical protein